jgi:hypothetical protein
MHVVAFRRDGEGRCNKMTTCEQHCTYTVKIIDDYYYYYYYDLRVGALFQKTSILTSRFRSSYVIAYHQTRLHVDCWLVEGEIDEIISSS